MKKKMEGKGRKKDILAIVVYLMAFYISLNMFEGLLYDILGVVFFVMFAYGVICVGKSARFIFR